MKLFIYLIIGAIMLTGCLDENSNQREKAKQEQMKLIADQSTGMPAITSFTEKKNLKMILEMRDNPNLPTFTYVKNLNGSMQKICNSIGYPIPYSTQYTNPQQVDRSSSGTVTLPMADPNGLYSPSSADGSYVMCLDKQTNKVVPLYSEERLITSTFPL